jgi:hypothetical protein
VHNTLSDRTLSHLQVIQELGSIAGRALGRVQGDVLSGSQERFLHKFLIVSYFVRRKLLIQPHDVIHSFGINPQILKSEKTYVNLSFVHNALVYFFGGKDTIISLQYAYKNGTVDRLFSGVNLIDYKLEVYNTCGKDFNP